MIQDDESRPRVFCRAGSGVSAHAQPAQPQTRGSAGNTVSDSKDSEWRVERQRGNLANNEAAKMGDEKERMEKGKERGREAERQRDKDKRHPREALSLNLSVGTRFARGLWRNTRNTRNIVA
jgi:hypothetical protein